MTRTPEVSAPNRKSSKHDDFNRGAVMREASDARGQGKRKRAVELYRQLLAHDAEDFEAHGKLAQLLAEGGEIGEASRSFHAGAEGYHHKGFTDRGIALLHQAVQSVPEDVDAWLRISELQMIRLKKVDAASTLASARKVFRTRKDLAAAARILQAQLQLEPGRLEIVVDLARVENKRGNRARAIELLETTITTVTSFDRKRLHKALFFIAPSPRRLWRWLKNTTPAARAAATLVLVAAASLGCRLLGAPLSCAAPQHCPRGAACVDGACVGAPEERASKRTRRTCRERTTKPTPQMPFSGLRGFEWASASIDGPRDVDVSITASG